jgi:serine protease Do
LNTLRPLSAILSALFVGAALAFSLIPVSTRGEENFIDDTTVKAGFEDGLTKRFKMGGLPTGATTAKQLREADGKQAPASLVAPFAEEIRPDPDTSDFTTAVARARASTLVFGHLFLCGKCDKYHGNLAGGLLISPDGLALTNYHVLNFREAIVFGAMTASGGIHAIDEVIAASKADDLALVRLRDAKNLPHVSIAPGLATGEDVFVISHPDGHFYSLTRGILARKYLTPKELVPRLQITADFAKGSSGCGIFNLRGKLAGLVTSTRSIYYHEADGKKDKLQMVVKSGVPLESITKLFQAPATAPP